MAMPREMLRIELEAAGYVAKRRPSRPGEFALAATAAHVVTRDFEFADGLEAGRYLRLTLDSGRVTSVRTGCRVVVGAAGTRTHWQHYPAHNEDRLLESLGNYPPELVAGLVVVETGSSSNTKASHGVASCVPSGPTCALVVLCRARQPLLNSWPRTFS